MKATELRIGNYILENFIQKDGGFKYELCVVDARIIHYAEHFGNEWSGKPVPLTEEWLEKFGFKKETAWYRLGKHAINPLLANLYEFKNIPIIEVAYVHSLQNLFYAISGCDLVLLK